MNIPDKIWLQREEGAHPDCDTYFGEGMTWCEDKVNNDDIEYVRKDVMEEYAKQKCKEQRGICAEHFPPIKGYSNVYDDIKNAPLATDK